MQITTCEGRINMKRINELYKQNPGTERVIQFGEGGFLRAFIDWMLDKLNKSGLSDAKSVIVQPIPVGMCEMLMAQDCVYTHILRGVENGREVVEQTVIGSVSRCVDPHTDLDAFLALAKDANFRFVVSNTTESGIAYEPEALVPGKLPKSFPAKVTLLLLERFQAGLGGFIFLPCELIDRNGDKLRECVLKYAADWQLGEDFVRFVKEENTFCTTLVDRIVTGYPKDEKIDLPYIDEMIDTSEYFHLWVIETDADIEAELPFVKAGLNVVYTPDLEPYRTRKVRILNGAHTSTVAKCMLDGIETVKDCMDDPAASAALKSRVFDEIVPTLTLPEEELKAYAGAVLERFANPYIRHYWKSISLNSVSKWKVRVLPSLVAYREKFGKLPAGLTASLGYLIKLYKSGMATDAEDVIAFMQEKSVAEILANEAFWDMDLSFLLDAVEEYAK